MGVMLRHPQSSVAVSRPVSGCDAIGASLPDGQEIDRRRRFVSRISGVNSRHGGRPTAAQRGRRVLEPTLDPLVGVSAPPDHRGLGRAVPLLFVRLAVQGHQLVFEAFQKSRWRKFRLPVHARLVEHAPRVNDKQ